MKYSILRHRKYKNNFKIIEARILALKFIIKNCNVSIFLRWEAFLLLSTISSKNLLKNKCLLTGRSRGFIRFFYLSRMKTRDLFRNGSLSFVKKSSW